MLKYIKTDSGYTVIWCDKRAEGVEIPSIYQGYPVTSIGDDAFSYCNSLMSITIPNSVTRIGENAFLNCRGLMSITIPNSVTNIGEWAFAGCSSLTSITIPDSVTSIGREAFAGCSSIASIGVEKNNQKYHGAGNCLIEIATKTLFAGCKTSVIPNDGSVTCIGSSAFAGCDSLPSITIPNSVTSIGNDAFYDCKMLTSKLRIYKAFKVKEDETLICRDMVYRLNEWNECSGELELCENGLHYCTNLFEIFHYYFGRLDKDIVICLCEVDGKILTSDTSKCCAQRLKPVRRLTRQEIIAILNGEELPI